MSGHLSSKLNRSNLTLFGSCGRTFPGEESEFPRWICYGSSITHGGPSGSSASTRTAQPVKIYESMSHDHDVP